MKKIIFISLIIIPLLSFGQGITFKVEELSKPEKLLYLQSYNDIYKSLTLKDASLSKWDIERSGTDFEYHILAKSEAPDSLVNYGYNSFFNGMYTAYADHRPFVLSPDMVWLLISQGFARHINANPEKLRKHLVDFSGQLTLNVNSNNDVLNDSINWEEIFPQLTTQIANHVGKELVNTLTSDFSTTTAVEKIASEITIMEAMEPYFEFVVFYVVCGIPEITLQGTTEDWQRILDKTKKLEKYNLRWWTKELEPILEQFVKASKGDINKRFWRNMFKYHSQRKYGAPNIIDGWIVKFFPYDKDGKRNKLNKLVGGNNLPEEMIKVDLKYVKTDGNHSEETMLELWAGFIGLEQNPQTFALTPKISWMVKKKDIDKDGLLKKLESDNLPCGIGIDLRIIEVPEILKKLDEIYYLSLEFKEDVFVPDWLSEKRIGRLEIEGKVSEAEKQKIIDWFPNTDLTINDKIYNSGNNSWITLDNVIDKDVISEELEGVKEIWILDFWPSTVNNELIIPDWFQEIKIDNLVIPLLTKRSAEDIEKLKQLLPKTNIYMNGREIQNAR